MGPIDLLFSAPSCEMKEEPVFNQPNQSSNAYSPASTSADKRDKNILLGNDPLSTQKPALVITILGSGHHSVEGELSDVSANGLCFLSPEAIPSGTPIRIDRPDSLQGPGEHH